MANSVKYTGGQFHKLLDKFADGVNHGTYRKVSYDMYRKLRKVAGEVKVSYKLNNGVYSAHVRDGDIIHSFPASDEDSFGYFLLKEVNKEANMHSDGNKTEYDIFGNVNYSNSIAGVPCDGMLTNVGSGYGWGDYNIDTLSTNCSTSVKTIAEVAKEEADRANNRIDEIEVDLKYEISDAKMTADYAKINVDAALDDIRDIKRDLKCLIDYKVDYDELEKRIQDTIYRLTAGLESAKSEIYAKLATKQDITFEYNLDGVMAQSTSSNVYPIKNYNINIKADYMSGSDNRKENENMDTNKMFAGFDFGPVSDNVKLSPYGMAIRNADGRYVSYDTKSGNIIDVEVFNFENHNLIFKMPVAVSAIAVGDAIVHMKKPMFVTSVENGITAIDIYNGEIKTIMPAQNMFGFNYVTKVVSMLNFTGANAPTAENPFGNMLPFMMMSDGFKSDNSDKFMMMAMMNGGNFTNMMNNPMMMYAMMNSKSNMEEMVPFLMMSGIFNSSMVSTPVENNCNCNCGNCGHE